jgi:23S rRNA A1618 N6-methylase RlmF
MDTTKTEIDKEKALDEMLEALAKMVQDLTTLVKSMREDKEVSQQVQPCQKSNLTDEIIAFAKKNREV